MADAEDVEKTQRDVAVPQAKRSLAAPSMRSANASMRARTQRIKFSMKSIKRSLTRARGTNDERAVVDKCLVLHGWRSNMEVSKLQAKRLRLLAKFRKAHCVNGTQAVDAAADEATMDLIDGPWFSWVDDRDGSLGVSEEARCKALRKALHGVAKFALAHGPYKSVIGFSQGGAIATLLSIPEVLEALGIEFGHLWQSSVVFCGASASLLDLTERALGISLEDCKSHVPSLHVFGFQDHFKPQGEALMHRFQTYNESGKLIRHCLYFDGGHSVPAGLEKDSGFHADFLTWLNEVTSSPVLLHPCRDEGALYSMPQLIEASDLDYESFKFETQPTVRREETDLAERGEGEGGNDSAASTYATADFLSSQASGATKISTPSGNELTFHKERASLAICDVKGNADELTVPELLSKTPRDSVLLRGMKSSQTPMTYGDMIDFIKGGDGDLRKVSASADSVVAYNVPPGPVGACAFLAIASQCTAVPLDPGITEEDAYDALTSCGVTLLLLFRASNEEAIERAGQRAGIPIKWYVMDDDEKPAGSYVPESPQPIGKESTALELPREAVGLLLRTSGTTSKSKVVPLIVGALTSNAATLAASLELNSRDVCINAMPLFHIGGLSCSILATIAAKSSVICCMKFDAAAFYDTITGTGVKPTWYSAVPTIHLTVLQYGNAISRGAKPTHALRFIRSGAAALSHADAQKLNDFWGVPIIPTYSMSEQMPISGKNVKLNLDDRADTVGQPLMCSVALVADGNCRPTSPFGQQGELIISGDNVMKAYQNAEEANNKTYVYIGDKRYLRTGDIARMDGDGFLYLTGRSKELIKRGGEQVSPLKVEAVLVQHPAVRVAVVFSVPSALWGEEVGVAIVLQDDHVDQPDEAIASIKKMMSTSKELARFEIPAHWKVVLDEDLPKTSTKKYKRAGLADILGMTKKVEETACSLKKNSAKPAVVSTGLSGLRYCMAVGVMFNHIGTVWQGDDERNPLTYGPAWWSAKATTFYFPATTFFVLGGFTLSHALNGKPVKKGTWLSFYNSRFQTLFPLYLLSLLCGLVNVLVVCRPETFSDEFSWQPHNDTLTLASGKLAQCQTSPVEMPYGAWLFMTLVVFCLGLQTWFPLWLLSSWFMYYTWFNGVYYFIILVFPFMQNALARVKGDVKAIQKWFIIYSVGTLMTAGLLACYYAFPAWEEQDDVAKAKSWKENAQNIYALSTMMFPPYWVPCVGSGMAAYFWYDAVRPNESHRKRLYGRIADALTLAYFAFHLAHFFDIDWPYPTKVTGKMWEVVPEEHHNWATGIKRYVWSVMITRLYAPTIAVWIALLSIPNGSVTGKLLESNILTKVLAPTSYGCFLFHQIIGQWYWWATRGGSDVPATDVGHKGDWSWWAYPKEYYWFSPQPLPVAWYEFFFVVGLVTCFSAFVDRVLNAPLTVLWIKFINFFQGIIWPGSVDVSKKKSGQVSPTQSVLNAVAALTGIDDNVSLDDSFDEIGLVSVGLPVLVGLINAEENFDAISAQDIAHCANLKAVVEVVEAKRKFSDAATGLGTALRASRKK